MRKIGTGEKGCVCVYVNKTSRENETTKKMREDTKEMKTDSVKHLIRYR